MAGAADGYRLAGVRLWLRCILAWLRSLAGLCPLHGSIARQPASTAAPHHALPPPTPSCPLVPPYVLPPTLPLFLQLAEYMFDTEAAMVRLDMSGEQSSGTGWGGCRQAHAHTTAAPSGPRNRPGRGWQAWWAPTASVHGSRPWQHWSAILNRTCGANTAHCRGHWRSIASLTLVVPIVLL